VRRSTAAAVVLLALFAAGCGGSGAEDGTKTTALTSLDLVDIVSPPPETPEGADYGADGASAVLTLADLQVRAATRAEKQTAAAFGRAGFTRVYRRIFVGAIVTLDTSAYLFRTGNGATAGLAALRKTNGKPGAQKAARIEPKGLGDDAWATHLTGSGSEKTVFLWRSGSLVLLADMSCKGSCTFDVTKAGLEYAHEVDARADDVS
jgi:hypothetical protein